MSQGSSIVEASIDDLAAALASHSLTCVDLVAKYLLRIGKYDCRNTALNSVPLLNENVFEEAATADERYAAGKPLSSLDGIPFTVKDSYKVKGMTVASGSEAFEDLIANEDAFTVEALRKAGAVLIGKTNMCPMAYGGMLRGVYGRAESPYNSDYLAAAFASGSSNGSGVSTASSFAAFGLGGETVSSGRSPASNNGLVCYTPSKGVISARGTWPLYPTCDVIISHTRSVDDLLILLDVVTTEDVETAGDFWRDQPFIPNPVPSILPQSFDICKDMDHLRAKRIAVPRMYITQCENGPYVSKSVLPLWEETKAVLEAAGAKIEIVPDFPAIEAYESMLSQSDFSAPSFTVLPENWNATERSALIAHAWEDFIQSNASSNIPSLTAIPPEKLFPQMPRSDPQVKFTEPANAVHWSKLSSYVSNRAPSSYQGKSPIYDTPALETAVQALEAMRKHFFEEWLSKHEYDYVIFPAAGDVARADADINYDSAEHAWRNGVKYSHGNRALRHLGIPGVTVPMGTLEPQKMPIGLTILGRAYDDLNILKAAYAFEQKSRKRVAPPLPSLVSDAIPGKQGMISASRPKLQITKCSAVATSGELVSVSIEGKLSIDGATNQALEPRVDVFVDGTAVENSNIKIMTNNQEEESHETRFFSCEVSVPQPPKQDARNSVVGKIARDSTMIMILARNGVYGRPSGYLKLIHASDM